MLSAHRLPICLVVALLGVGWFNSGHESAQAMSPQDDANNAAMWYGRAMERIDGTLTDDEWNLVSEYIGSSLSAPSPAVRSAVAKAQAAMGLVRRGAAQEYSDNQLDYSQGFEMLLPHLSPMRRLARVMKADAMIRLQDGDSAGAADRLSSLYRMSSHCPDDRTLISGLVGQAVFSMTDSGVQEAIDHGLLGPAESAALLSALEPLNHSDPFDYADSVAMEQEIGIVTIEKYLEKENGIAELAGLLGEGGAQERLLELDEESIRAGIDAYDRTMTRVGEIFMIEDREVAAAKMEELSAEIESGMHGPVVMLLMPAFGKVLENRSKAEHMLAARMAVLTELAQGEAKPEEVANAALWYLRAIEDFEKLPPEQIAAIRAAASDLGAPLNPQTRELLTGKQVQDILDIVRDGALKKRCDFIRAAPQPDNLQWIPSYGPGMHDVLHLIHADAVRAASEGDAASLTDRLGMLYRVCGHLGTDPSLISALTAHDHFNTTFDQMADVLQSGLLNDSHKPRLIDALERISRKDPMGYVGALAESRRRLSKQILSIAPGGAAEERAEQSEAARVLVPQFPPSRVLFMNVVMETFWRAAAGVDEQSPNGQAIKARSEWIDRSLARMADVLPREDVEAARNEAPVIAPLMARHRWMEVASFGPIIDMWDVEAGMRAARSDVRRAMLLLKPDSAPDAVSQPPATP